MDLEDLSFQTLIRSSYGFLFAWLLFWWKFHRARMIQNWIQMKGTDANISCTKFEWIWKTWPLNRCWASFFSVMIAWLLFEEFFSKPEWSKIWFKLKVLMQMLLVPSLRFHDCLAFISWFPKNFYIYWWFRETDNSNNPWLIHPICDFLSRHFW